MNEDTMKGNWKELKGRIKEQWGKLTDDEINESEGNLDQLAGKIQARYGEGKDQAKIKLNEMFSDRKH